MKYMTLLTAIFFIITGCDDGKIKKQETSIYGTWQLVEQYVVNGVNGSWQPVSNGYVHEISSTKTFKSNQYNECNRGSISIKSDSISFNYDCEGFTSGIESPKGVFTYLFSINKGVLTLNPTFLICVEGCGYKFEKISEVKEQTGD